MKKGKVFKGITRLNLRLILDKLEEFMEPGKKYKLVYLPDARSEEISTRFHGHVTFMARELAMDRNYVYFMALLKATEIQSDGGDPYPYVTIKRKIKNPISGKVELHDLPNPLRTSGRTNKEMMTACAACQVLWYDWGGSGPLPEKYDNLGRINYE